MADKTSKFLLGGISLPYTAGDSDFISEAKKKLNGALGLDANKPECAANAAQFRFYIRKKSVDARHKNDIRIVSSVLVETELPLAERHISALKNAGFNPVTYETPDFSAKGEEKLAARPLVVGCGPAGMFCALVLAENGYEPILIERGGSVADREASYDDLCKNGSLNTECNIQFGVGGAGTFSDGKLTTRINDKFCYYALERFVEFGAPEDVLIKAKPHIGTDVIRNVVTNIVERIKSLGGKVVLNCRLDGLLENQDGGLTAKTSQGDIACGCAVLAIGHSARDTAFALRKNGYFFEPKAFSVGVRIEHLQKEIDEALYGSAAGDRRLGPAEYNFSDTTGRGVYTFCMCPGGEVVAAATERDGVVVNGMSNRARNGKNANAALAVTVRPDDYGNTVDTAVEYQRKLERLAFSAGGGKFFAPCQTVGDFMTGKFGGEPTKVLPSYMGGKVTMTDLSSVLPIYVAEELRRGISSFSRKLKGFDAPYALLTGVETRTSSPIRMPRGEDLSATGHALVYPCGEGAGYAGGIMSASVDGIKTALRIMRKFRVNN